MTGASLEVVGIMSGYGQTRVIDDVSFRIEANAALAVLGRNGAGKTTLMATLAGRLTTTAGELRLDGASITRCEASARCRLGVGFVPQDRQIFRTLTVEENLHIADLKRGWTVGRVYELFPRLAERRRNYGGQLSGGEQQMLAIARALMGSPRCLLLDEPFEGLAPVIVESLLEALTDLRRAASMTIVIVEQHARLAVEMADQGILIERGKIRTAGTREELLGRWPAIEDMLAVTH